jgi:hypothetical protein
MLKSLSTFSEQIGIRQPKSLKRNSLALSMFSIISVLFFSEQTLIKFLHSGPKKLHISPTTKSFGPSYASEKT